MIGQCNPIRNEEADETCKECAEGKSPQTNHVEINQRHKVEYLWKQEAADTETEEAMKNRNRSIYRFIASE